MAQIKGIRTIVVFNLGLLIWLSRKNSRCAFIGPVILPAASAVENLRDFFTPFALSFVLPFGSRQSVSRTRG
jgi:hypothetical protein